MFGMGVQEFLAQGVVFDGDFAQPFGDAGSLGDFANDPQRKNHRQSGLLFPNRAQIFVEPFRFRVAVAKFQCGISDEQEVVGCIGIGGWSGCGRDLRARDENVQKCS